MSAQPRPDKDNTEKKPNGPRTPYPVEHPGIREQPGTEPDVFPGVPGVLPKL